MRALLTLFFILWLPWPALARTPNHKTLPIGLAPQERGLEITPAAPTAPPEGAIHALQEWGEAQAVMTLWPNPSLISALVKHGAVKLIADTRGDQNWWASWLAENHIPADRVSYFLAPTDSIWIRDYGPWPILDGNGNFGFVHNTYNRPRPQDDKVAGILAETLHIPLYVTGLVHTGGNYYVDGVGDGFSSTLAYEENSSLSQDEVNARMKSFLGIDHYVTSPLAPGITIEHLDTFGKLVTPDTWVFSEFPESSPYRDDSEKMVQLLKTLTSPYGTPYKIHRLKMTSIDGGEWSSRLARGPDRERILCQTEALRRPCTVGTRRSSNEGLAQKTPRDGSGASREDHQFRAYINSFQSNGVLYFPAYGDAVDDEAKGVYQAALPGWEIVGVDAMDTAWGDSVHCRTRNLLETATLFIFPTVGKVQARQPIAVSAEIFAAPGTTLVGNPVIHWSAGGRRGAGVAMSLTHGRVYEGSLPAQAAGTKLALYLEAKDTGGHDKLEPSRAPQLAIDVEVR